METAALAGIQTPKGCRIPPKKPRPEKSETHKSMGLHVFTFDLVCLEVTSGITNPSSENFEHSLKTNLVP